MKRRTSLDNSCLSAAHASLKIMMQEQDSEEYANRRPRRFSLNNNSTIAVTFLATVIPSGHRKSDALDLDLHCSEHGSNDGLPRGKQMSFGTAETLSFDDDSSCFSLDTDCASFCDASVQEQANKEYLQKDLGASCFWDIDFSDMGDDDEGTTENAMPAAIAESDELDLSDA